MNSFIEKNSNVIRILLTDIVTKDNPDVIRSFLTDIVTKDNPARPLMCATCINNINYIILAHHFSRVSHSKVVTEESGLFASTNMPKY